MKMRTFNWLSLLGVLLILAGAGAQAQEPVLGPQVVEVSKPWGHWAGPDLRGRQRDLNDGDIVGKPPSAGTSPASTAHPAPAVPAPANPPGPPATPPAPPSVSPPPATPAATPPVSVAPVNPVAPLIPTAGGIPIQQLFDNGSLVPLWIGQGRVGGEMISLGLENTTDQPIAIDLDPGMALELDDVQLQSAFQPIMIESDQTITVPARSSVTTMLRAYCLDYSLEPPSKGRAFPYRFPADATAYAPAANVLRASLSYDAQRNVLPPEQQRTVVIQRSIWAALGQTDKNKLYEDILTDAAKAGKYISKKKAKKLADALWSEVERLQRAAR